MSLSIQRPDKKKLLNNKTKQNKTKHFTCEFKHSAARREKASQQQNKTKQNILHVRLIIQQPDEKKLLNNKTKQNKTFYMWV